MPHPTEEDKWVTLISLTISSQMIGDMSP